MERGICVEIRRQRGRDRETENKNESWKKEIEKERMRDKKRGEMGREKEICDEEMGVDGKW